MRPPSPDGTSPTLQPLPAFPLDEYPPFPPPSWRAGPNAEWLHAPLFQDPLSGTPSGKSEAVHFDAAVGADRHRQESTESAPVLSIDQDLPLLPAVSSSPRASEGFFPLPLPPFAARGAELDIARPISSTQSAAFCEACSARLRGTGSRDTVRSMEDLAGAPTPRQLSGEDWVSTTLHERRRRHYHQPRAERPSGASRPYPSPIYSHKPRARSLQEINSNDSARMLQDLECYTPELGLSSPRTPARGTERLRADSVPPLPSDSAHGGRHPAMLPSRGGGENSSSPFPLTLQESLAEASPRMSTTVPSSIAGPSQAYSGMLPTRTSSSMARSPASTDLSSRQTANEQHRRASPGASPASRPPLADLAHVWVPNRDTRLDFRRAAESRIARPPSGVVFINYTRLDGVELMSAVKRANGATLSG